MYLALYLVIIGVGLLFAPEKTLELLQSNGEYGNIFPRLAGMLMSGLGVAVFGIIQAHAFQLYPATLAIRVYFIVCQIVFYAMTGDPLFLDLRAIVGLGPVLTLTAYILDLRK